jgi:hypothetical protein
VHTETLVAELRKRIGVSHVIVSVGATALIESAGPALVLTVVD